MQKNLDSFPFRLCQCWFKDHKVYLCCAEIYLVLHAISRVSWFAPDSKERPDEFVLVFACEFKSWHNVTVRRRRQPPHSHEQQKKLYIFGSCFIRRHMRAYQCHRRNIKTSLACSAECVDPMWVSKTNFSKSFPRLCVCCSPLIRKINRNEWKAIFE